MEDSLPLGYGPSWRQKAIISQTANQPFIIKINVLHKESIKIKRLLPFIPIYFSIAHSELNLRSCSIGGATVLNILYVCLYYNLKKMDCH